ncbi:MAG: DUF6079 family protein [Desulfomonilaceae bacterium]
MSMQETSLQNVLDHTWGACDKMIEDWKAALVANLEDPATHGNRDLLKLGSRKMVAAFLKTEPFPDEIGADFLQALHEALPTLTVL